MTEVIGVKFRTAGKVYYFSPKGLSFSRGEYAIVETSRPFSVQGLSFGRWACEMRRNCSAAMVYAADRSAVIAIFRNLPPYPSRWRRTRAYP